MGNASKKLAAKCTLLTKEEQKYVAATFRAASKNSDKIREDDLITLIRHDGTSSVGSAGRCVLAKAASGIEHYALPNRCLLIETSAIHSCMGEKKDPKTTTDMSLIIIGTADFTINFSKQNFVSYLLLMKIPEWKLILDSLVGLSVHTNNQKLRPRLKSRTQPRSKSSVGSKFASRA
ncbi:hypothetical protein EVAR_84276_1 [Eumeta japonica]|uniref:Uncharacterized protein n=1 Tax=Eumeta variegata TaxID=151549 RepID=A0A4C1WT85_EUMVA|nr:hypothetical protein EVAR_84276_1 [Eumeta japonica]